MVIVNVLVYCTEGVRQEETNGEGFDGKERKGLHMKTGPS